MTWGMPWTMQNREFLLTHADRIALLKPLIGLENTHGWKTEHFALSWQGMDEKGIVGMWPDNGQPQPLGENSACADMIQVTVGQEDTFWFKL